MKNGLLSIVMVSYNHGPYLKEAIQSVISQTYKNWELIIIDDGSSDNSREIAGEYAAKLPGQIKLSVHKGKENLGIATSYILGLRLCQGEFIGFLESDDIWSDINAEVKIDALSDNNVGLVYSNVKPIGESGTISMRNSCLTVFPTLPANVPFEAFRLLSSLNFVPSFSTVIARRGIFTGLKFISDKKYAIWLDWFLWLQVSLKTRFLFIPQTLVAWRLYKNSYCNRFFYNSNLIKLVIFDFKYRIMVLRKFIFPCKCDTGRKLRLLWLFVMGYLKRPLVYKGLL